MSGLKKTVLAGLVFLSGMMAVEADDRLSEDALRAAVKRTIPLLENSAAGSAKQRQCFTCHNQAMPVFVLTEAGHRGFQINDKVLKQQLDHTAAHLKRGLQNYREGRGQGGRVLTAGYALWTLEAGDRRSNQVTTAVTGFLLSYQKEKQFWSHPGSRPPSSGSNFTTTYVALRGLDAYGVEAQSEQIAARKKTVLDWLRKAEPKDTEDYVFRLRSLRYVDATGDEQGDAAASLVALQRDDGGWGQTPEMETDAYATGSALVALLRNGASAESEPIQRGLKYLVSAQRDDGSWHIVTRARPFQKYFESGFPHGKDQFVSISGTSWAALAFVLALPEPPAKSTASTR